MIVGPVVFLFILLVTNFDPTNPLVSRCAAVASLMAIWWITEAIPIPATALLPVALFPMLGIVNAKEIAAVYFNDVIFLFIGGFLIALAMQKWMLHRRIALKIILLIGTSPRRIYLGFMVATFFLSMWISNTATTMMLVPMAMAIIIKMKENFGEPQIGRFAVGLLIAIAYAASIGGFATLIGTPPNMAFVRILAISFPDAPEISFARWLAFAFPPAVLFLVIAWAILTRIFIPQTKTGSPVLETDSPVLEADSSALNADLSVFRKEYHSLGRMRREERLVLILFLSVALLWIFRQPIDLNFCTIPGWSSLFPDPKYIRDGTVAIMVALLLFIIPAKKNDEAGPHRLLDWSTAMKINWGIVLLFGGGFALATGFSQSGLAKFLGGQLAGLGHFSPLIIVLTVCLVVTFLTELTSNTATTEIFMPILGAMAVAIGINPLMLMIPATLSASCAFMLPVATPPNAIIFGTGEVKIHDMMRAGIIMNIVGIFLITGAIYLIGIYVFDMDLSAMPTWADGL